MNGATCLGCSADLTEPHSVSYRESYEASARHEGDAVVVQPRSSSVDAAAFCAACGVEMSYSDVDFTS